jgi:hypothetical protein
MMTLLTWRGRDIIATCDERSSIVVAWARSAMNRWVAGGIVRSCAATTYHVGMSSQAGVPEGWLRVATPAGRWLLAITASRRRERSPAKISWKTVGLM